MNVKKIAALTLASLTATAHAQQSLETAYRTTGSAVVAAFEPQRQVLQASSAVILDGRKEISYGVVISPDGDILTKASEVLDAKSLAVTVDQTRYAGAKIVMVDPTWDVALITIDAHGLTPVEYAASSAVPQGTWIVANGATSRKNRRALAGIVSANIREILPEGGAVLGVVLDPKSKKLRIADVDSKSGAKEAGLAEGDMIVALDGQKVKDIQAVAEFLKDRRAGTTVKLTYRRGKTEQTVDVRLSARGQVFKGKEELSRNDQMSGEYSLRRSGFPRILEHDILGNRSTAGGPLIDLDGHCLGMNIARANRAESFAIPVEDLQEIAARMMKQAGR